MKCPHCTSNDIQVLDSRPCDNDRAIRRRRKCKTCGDRFSTIEQVEVSKQGRPKCAPEIAIVQTDVEPPLPPEPEPEPVPVAPVLIISGPGPAPVQPAVPRPMDRQTKRQIIDDMRERYKAARRCANGF